MVRSRRLKEFQNPRSGGRQEVDKPRLTRERRAMAIERALEYRRRPRALPADDLHAPRLGARRSAQVKFSRQLYATDATPARRRRGVLFSDSLVDLRVGAASCCPSASAATGRDGPNSTTRPSSTARRANRIIGRTTGTTRSYRRTDAPGPQGLRRGRPPPPARRVPRRARVRGTVVV